jgi:HD-GYP domain-containing protein (c-di-GMP phosphodiesterase class II)
MRLGEEFSAAVALPLARPQDEKRLRAALPLSTSLLVPGLAQLAAIERIRELEDHSRQASAALDSSQILLSATLGPDQLADLLLDLAVRSTESNAAFILVEPSVPGEHALHLLASRSLPASLAGELGSLCHQPGPLLPSEAAIIHEPNSESSLVTAARQAGFGSAVQAPISVDGRIQGVVMLLKKDGSFAPGHLRACQLSAGRLAFTIKNRRYHEEVFAEYKETLKALVHTMESGASHLNGHSLRVAWIAAELARELGLPPSEAEGIELAGELHDVGMVGLSEEILFKPGRLTSQEYDLVKHHPTVGAALTAPVKLPVPIGPLILHHHERHDGFGYPAGLKGEGIPLGARILALGEVFDAMVSSRTYREALPIAEALNKLHSLAGTQLDPLVVDCFIKIMNGARGRSLYPQNSVER